MLPKGASFLLALALSVALVSAQSRFFYIKRDQPFHHHHHLSQNRRSSEEDSVSSEPRRFDPDSLHRFLDEYANKVRRTTEKPQAYKDSVDHDETRSSQPQANVEKLSSSADHESFGSSPQPQQNETAKKQKLYNSNSPSDDRNGGWVTLDAVPWSKSKISKWQPNSMTHEAWPSDNKPYDKPSSNKYWDSDYSSRPSYESNKHWPNKLTKPQWSDNSPSSSNKPWHSQDRPRPNHQSFPPSDKYDDYTAQAQKWPPERPNWERYPDSSRPSLEADIITDDGPSNFPSPSWDRPSGQRPSYTHHVESYVSEPNSWNDRNDYAGLGPSKYPPRPNPSSGPGDDYYHERPHFSHYHYPSSGSGAGGPHQGPHSQRHHPNSPFSGNGEWVLVSTNRGYSKSRQRSIKFDALNATVASGGDMKKQGEEEETFVPSMTSKRQVRLMVLPPANGDNTTTSHGGLLEVEKTFKTVDQSKAEYDAAKGLNKKADVKPSSFNHSPSSTANRPGQQTSSVSPGNSAVLAAVGAGMLPATMAMVLPMMLGRKKRQTSLRLERWPTEPRNNQM